MEFVESPRNYFIHQFKKIDDMYGREQPATIILIMNLMEVLDILYLTSSIFISYFQDNCNSSIQSFFVVV